MLARDYRYVGRQGSLVVEWNSGIGRLQSVGNDRENDITISDSVNHEVQVKFSTPGITIFREDSILPASSAGRAPVKY